MGSELNRVMQKYRVPNQGMAQTLGAMGRYGDSLVAHITPEEAMMLKSRGGAGTINPLTGLLEFYDADSGQGGDPSGGDSNSDSGGGSSEDEGFGAFGGSISPEQAAHMAALESQASAALSAFAATPDTLNDPSLAQAFTEAVDARDAFMASLETAPGGSIPGIGGTYGAPATQSGLGTTATNVSAVEGSPGMGVNVGTTSVGGGYDNYSGNSPGGSQLGNFEALYGQTLGRAPEAGALAFWANYANTHGLEAAQAAFNYGAAREIAARDQAAATANAPGGLTGVTTGVAAGSGSAAFNTSGAGSNGQDGGGGGAGGGGAGFGGAGFSGAGSGGNIGGDGGGYIPPTVTAPIVTTTPATTTPTTTPATNTTPTSNFQFVPYSAPASYGFELDRLMRQYGVSTPTMMPFAGYTTQTTPDDARRAEYDRTAYQNYVDQFNNRLAQTNMYNRAQFVPEPAKFTPQYSTPLANPAYAPTNYGGIYNTYTKYFGRAPEEAGIQYWGKMGATGDALQNAILRGAQNSDLDYLRSQYPDMKFARGGAVKTRYAEGGEVEEPETERSNRGPLTPEGAARMAALLGQMRPTTNYGAQLAGAQQAARSETEAFSNMIRQMSERAESPTSRAEMYFRLASAFGAPTRTGQFTENLGLAGREMGEYARGRRTDEAERRALALRAQELRMAGARQDLASLQTLAGQEAAAQRAINLRMIDAQMRGATPNARETRINDTMQTLNVDRPTAIRIVDNLIVAVPGPAGEAPTFFDRSTNEIIVPRDLRREPREPTPPQPAPPTPAAAPTEAEAPAVNLRRPQAAAATAPTTAAPTSVEDLYAGRRQRQVEQAGRTAEAEARGRVAAPPAPRQDFRYTQDFQAVEPIPGSVAAQEAEQRARAERVRRESEQQAGFTVMRAIDDAERTVRTATLPTTGFFAERLSGVGGTAARNLRADLETIRANIGFDQLNQMRQASPTGGSLGNVSNADLAFLQAVMGSVDQSQSEEQLLRNLRRLRDAFEEVIHYGRGNRPQVQIPGPGGRGTAEPPQGAGAAPAASGEIRLPSGVTLRPLQ